MCCLIPKRGGGGRGVGACEGRGGEGRGGRGERGFLARLNIPSEEVLTSNFTWVLSTLIFSFLFFRFCLLPRRIIPGTSLLK